MNKFLLDNKSSLFNSTNCLPRVSILSNMIIESSNCLMRSKRVSNSASTSSLFIEQSINIIFFICVTLLYVFKKIPCNTKRAVVVFPLSGNPYICTKEVNPFSLPLIHSHTACCIALQVGTTIKGLFFMYLYLIYRTIL